jgi:hypothetical protein
MPVWLSPFGDRRFAAVATGVPRLTLFRVVLINVGSPAELPQLTVMYDAGSIKSNNMYFLKKENMIIKLL